MKTTGVQPGSSKPSASSKSAQPSSRQSFSKILDTRRGKGKSADGSESARKTSLKEKSLADASVDFAPAGLDLSVGQTRATTSKVTDTLSVNLKEGIRALAREINFGVNAAGKEQIEIQLNSKTFDGLRIQIVRDQGLINIQFQARTQELSQLLTENVGALTNSLADHGIKVGQIRVNESASSRWFGKKPSDHLPSGAQSRRRQK